MRHEVNLRFSTAAGCYCNAETGFNARSKECCRFCVDKAKIYGRKAGSGMYCMLWNHSLSENDGLVTKCPQCMTPFKHHEIVDYDEVDQEEAVQLDISTVATVVRKEIKKCGRTAKKYLKSGLPAEMAIDVAVEDVSYEWL